MNKLAPIALVLLLFFGSALWYLANNSLNEHVRAKIMQVGSYYTDLVVTVDKAEINLDHGDGLISGIKIKNQHSFQQNDLLTIEQITFSFDKSSINQKIIVINDISLNNSKLNNENNANQQNNLSQLLATINQKINQIQDARRQKAEPYIRANSISLINATYFNSALPASASTIKQISLDNIGSETGLPASLFGIELLRKSIEKMTKVTDTDIKQKNSN